MERNGKRRASVLTTGAWLLTACAAAIAMPDSPEQTTATRELPPRVREDVDAITRQLLQVRDADNELSCARAVENGRSGVETMLEVGQRNLDGGYLARADFDRMAAPLRTQLEGLTLADCEGATGERREFYRCMSSDYNHVLACAKAHG